MKYIRHAELGFIVFSKHTDHDKMAAWFGGKDKVISAGFAMANPKGDEMAPLVCFGESTTLRIPSKEDDSTKLNAQLV